MSNAKLEPDDNLYKLKVTSSAFLWYSETNISLSRLSANGLLEHNANLKQYGTKRTNYLTNMPEEIAVRNGNWL